MPYIELTANHNPRQPRPILVRTDAILALQSVVFRDLGDSEHTTTILQLGHGLELRVSEDPAHIMRLIGNAS